MQYFKAVSIHKLTKSGKPTVKAAFPNVHFDSDIQKRKIITLPIIQYTFGMVKLNLKQRLTTKSYTRSCHNYLQNVKPYKTTFVNRHTIVTFTKKPATSRPKSPPQSLSQFRPIPKQLRPRDGAILGAISGSVWGRMIHLLQFPTASYPLKSIATTTISTTHKPLFRNRDNYFLKTMLKKSRILRRNL